jgi:phospholipid/cholesterol/gamma-HCH transport system substrate-binding protein
MEFQGLTGIAVLTLSGGTPNSPKLVGSTTNPPVIVADSASSADLTQAARETLRHVDEFIAENKQSFHDAIQNIDTFSAALARNSERVDKIMQGLQNLTAGEDGKSGEINDAVKQLKKVADNANKQVSSLGAEAHRTIANINQAVKDFSKNPGKFLFGGSKE